MSNTELIPTWFESVKLELLSGISLTLETLQHTSLKFVAAIDRDVNFRDYIQDECPDVNGTVWRTLEKVGRGLLDARIACGSAAYGIKLRRLNISDQRRALDCTLPLLTVGGDTLQVRLDALLPRQAEQIFASDHIRQLDEQRAWLEAQSTLASVKRKHVSGIQVDRRHKRVVVNGVQLTIKDLVDLVKQLS